MEPIIDHDDSPFSNLDLWCDWNGNPEDSVSIKISMEVISKQKSDYP